MSAPGDDHRYRHQHFQRTTTDERGSYIFNGLHPATYRSKAESLRFRAEETKDVVLGVSQHTNIDFALQVAGLEAQITVVEAPPTLETGNADIWAPLSAANTPATCRFTAAAISAWCSCRGGVTESAGSGIRDNYPSGTNFISNGQRNATAEVRFDGAPISAPEQGEGGNTNVYYTPSVEVIQEFKVENNSFSAEYGNNGGTVLNIMMKQGGNQFHGSGWWFGQRDALDANDFFSNQAGIGKPPHIHDQYGGSVSGPIKKNKTFFLFDLEKQRDIGSGQTVSHLAHRPAAGRELFANHDVRRKRQPGAGDDLQSVCNRANGTRQPFRQQHHTREPARSRSPRICWPTSRNPM